MVWDAFIALYLFLAGLGAGAFVLGTLTNWAKDAAPTLKKIAFVIGPVAVAVGTLVLVVDAKAGLMNPLRFFGLVANLNSVMAWGVIILSAFLVVAAIDLVLLLVKKQTPKWLDIVGSVLALCVAAYTGVLLGDAGMAFPLWNMAILPVLFVVSAASTGIAAVLLVAYFVKPEEVKALRWLPKAGLALPVIEAVVVVALLVATASTAGAGAEAAAASVANLMSGTYAVAFWLGFVVIGLVLPFALEIVRHRGENKNGKALAIVGEVGVLVGGFMLRYLVVMAAVAVSVAVA